MDYVSKEHVDAWVFELLCNELEEFFLHRFENKIYSCIFLTLLIVNHICLLVYNHYAY